MAWHERDYNRGGGGFGGGGGGGGFRGGGGGDMLRSIGGFLNMSFGIGTYLGIRVRVHITFLLLVGFRLLFAPGDAFWTLRWTALLFLSVLLHEFGHALACRRVGGMANDILMWPLGGLAFVAPPRRPWPEFVTVIWGPLVNVIIAAGCYVALSAWPGLDGMPVSLNPLFYRYAEYLPGVPGLLVDLYLTNYALLLFNMLLVFYPFDGGRLVQIALWTKMGYERSMRFAARVGMGGAVLIALYGLAVTELLLIFIALFGFITCYRQNQYIQAAGVGFGTQGQAFDPGYYDQWKKPKRQGWLARQHAARAQKKAARQRKKEQAESAEVDRLLAKVSAKGLHSLTEREKKVLKRATDKQRRAS